MDNMIPVLFGTVGGLIVSIYLTKLAKFYWPVIKMKFQSSTKEEEEASEDEIEEETLVDATDDGEHTGDE
jgi:hypothetical protein